MADMETGNPYIRGNKVDFHVHIIPGVDDGAADMAKALEMADIMCQMGIHTAIATPHYIFETDPRGFFSEVRGRYRALCDALDDKGIPLKLLLGFEVRSTEELIHIMYMDQLAIQGTSYILVEPPFWGYPSWFDEMLYTIRLSGYTPVLAHPERCDCFMKRPERVKKLSQQGALIQCNLGSFMGAYGFSVKRSVHKLLAAGLVDVIGTDAHSPRMLAMLNQYLCSKWQKIDGQQRSRIFEEKALGLLDGIGQPSFYGKEPLI